MTRNEQSNSCLKMTCFHNNELCYLYLFQLLTRCGDVEPNSDPIGRTKTGTPKVDGRNDVTVDETGGVGEDENQSEPIGLPRVRKNQQPSKTKLVRDHRGLNGGKKVRHLANYLFKNSCNCNDLIVLLQQTNVRELKQLDCVCRGDNYVTPGHGNSLGCITILSQSL